MLLDYVFEISSITPTPPVATGFLKRALAIVKPNSGNVGSIVTCTSPAQVSAITDNADVAELFNAGMDVVYVLPTNSVDVSSVINEDLDKFYTVLVSSDFDHAELFEDAGTAADATIQDITYTAEEAGVAGNDITINYNDGNTDGAADVSVSEKAITVSIETGVTTALTIVNAINAHEEAGEIVSASVAGENETNTQTETAEAVSLTGGIDPVYLNLGMFDGVVGISSDNMDNLEAYAAQEKRCGFYSTNGAKSMFEAFGKLLSNALAWRNNQYVSMSFDDGIDNTGIAKLLFDKRISFVYTDTQFPFAKRLGFFACGGQAIVAPYIIKDIKLNLQSKALNYLASNQPQYTQVEASLLENSLQDVINIFIGQAAIEAGKVEVKLEQANFVASGYINVSEPKALWRVLGELRQTL